MTEPLLRVESVAVRAQVDPVQRVASGNDQYHVSAYFFKRKYSAGVVTDIG